MCGPSVYVWSKCECVVPVCMQVCVIKVCGPVCMQVGVLKVCSPSGCD